MLWLLGGLTALCGLYLLAVAPNLRNRKERKAALPRVPFAHRGLYGGSAPENSLAAFRRAAQKGYGIELDVHLTRDGRLAVIHDGDLGRMCGVSRRAAQMTMEEIKAHRLLNTEEAIPSLEEALSAVSPCRTPLILEMKSDPENRRLLPRALFEAMKGYPGFWCVESFDPRMLFWFRRHAPGVIRGQLAFDPRKIGLKCPPLFILGADLLMNFLSRPDFVAYGHETDRNLSFRLVRRLFRPALAAWTVKNPRDFNDLRTRYDLQIFEAFDAPFDSANIEKEKPQ